MIQQQNITTTWVNNKI